MIESVLLYEIQALSQDLISCGENLISASDIK